MKITFTREQILEVLAPLYQAAYDEYFSLTELSTQLLHEEEDRAYTVIARRAVNKSHFMDGIQTAAEALGIEPPDLRTAASELDKGVRYAKDKA